MAVVAAGWPRRCPWCATAVTVALMLLLAPPMDSRVSFHGRTVREAFHPVRGAVITAQAIPENLVLANLGLDAPTTPIQGLVLTLCLILLWASRRLRPQTAAVPPARAATDSASPDVAPQDVAGRRWFWPSFTFNPLECAGAATVVGCYLLEWTFRGYFEYHYLRTLTPYTIVPWYDVIPQIGAVLFAMGWWSGPHRPNGSIPRAGYGRLTPPSRSAALGLALLTLGLVSLNRPRVDALIRGTCPPLVGSENEQFRIERLQTMRANALLLLRVNWQRRYLRRLDQAERVARRLGIGQDGIRAAFGNIIIPGSTGRITPVQRELYDVAAILDLPAQGRLTDPAAIRAVLERYLLLEPEPRPPWLAPGDRWPEP